MKHALQLRQTQRLQLNAQLTQSLKILQLGRAEIDLEIRAALDANPFLEENSAANALDVAFDAQALVESDSSRVERTSQGDERLGETPSQHATHEETRWDEGPYSRRVDSDFDFSSEPDQSMWADPGNVLRQRLLSELALHRLNETDNLIANALIESLDEKGYLTASHPEICAILANHLRPTDEEIDAVLHLIQSIAVPGIGARDLRECLLLQLERLDLSTPGLSAATKIIDKHMSLLASHAYPALMEKTGEEKSGLAKAISLIQSLDPKPGEQISPKPTEVIIPDVIVRNVENNWVVQLTRRDGHRVRVNESYRDYLKAPDAETRQYIRDHMREAHGFVRSLEQRDQTILRVAEAIVAIQQDFMTSGDHGLTPLTLREVSETLDIHESTVSRAVDKKNLLTPLGVYPFKHFFSSGLGNRSGVRVSARAAQARIRKVIESEPVDRPISDGALAQILGAEGIPIARRTVAKYRDQMNIPPAAQRRGLR